MLNDKAARAAKAGTHRAGKNLYLRVSGAGTKTFYVRVFHKGKAKMVSIGRYPDLSLSDARVKAAEIVDVVTSEDPSRAALETQTVQEAMDAYLAHLKKKYRRPQTMERYLNKDILPHIGTRKLAELTRADCTAVIRKIVDRGAPVAANRALELLKRALVYFHQQGWVETNPMLGVGRGAMGGREKAREVTLSFDEIREFFRFLLHEDRVTLGSKWALHMILLTGQRSTEVLTMAPDGTTITKMNRKHQVPMTPYVRAMLRNKPPVPRLHSTVADWLRKFEFHFTPHDLRRTFASRLSDLGVLPHVIEKMLDHQMTGVMAVYNRGTFWPDRYAAQRLWEKKLNELRREARKTPGWSRG